MANRLKAAYGLEISSGRLVLVRWAHRGIAEVVLAAASNSAEACRALESVTLEVEKGNAALAVSAPAVQTAVRCLRAPFASARKAAKVWASLLDVELPFPVESAICCYGDPRIENGTTVALASAIRKNDMAAFAAACRTLGFDPTHCDAEALALWSQQATETPPARREGPRAIVWLGADHVTIARGRGREFMAAHVLRATPLAEAPGERQAFEFLWSARIQQILAAHLAETGGAEMDLWWAGPGAEDDERVVRLRHALPVDMAIRHETHRQPASFLARALARRAAEDAGVNFKSDEWTHPAIQRAQVRHLQRAYRRVVAAAVLVLALNGGESLLRTQRAESLQRQLTAAAQSIAEGTVLPGQEALMVERAIYRRDEETQPFRNALDLDGMEGRLARAIEDADALSLDISRLSLSSATMLIEGSAPSIQSIEGLGERLRGQGWAIQTDSPGRTPEGRQQFILKGALNHAG